MSIVRSDYANAWLDDRKEGDKSDPSENESANISKAVIEGLDGPKVVINFNNRGWLAHKSTTPSSSFSKSIGFVKNWLSPSENPSTETKWEDYIVNVELQHNPDDQWTARDSHWELTAQGKTANEALDNLGKVIAAVEGDAGHEPNDDEIEQLGVDPQDAKEGSGEEVPDFLQ